jgi:hypothetical protein
VNQVGDIRHGFARTILNLNEDSKTYIKKEGLLTTRDSRMVERKKSGRPKTRKRFQLSLNVNSANVTPSYLNFEDVPFLNVVVFPSSLRGRLGLVVFLVYDSDYISEISCLFVNVARKEEIYQFPNKNTCRRN